MQTSARQYRRVAIEKITPADLDGTSKNLFTKLGNGVLPLALAFIVVTPFDTGTTHVLDVGDGATADAYAADINLKAAAGTRVDATALPGLINTTDGGLQLKAVDTPAGTPATEGELLVVLEYAEIGVEQFSQG